MIDYCLPRTRIIAPAYYPEDGAALLLSLVVKQTAIPAKHQRISTTLNQRKIQGIDSVAIIPLNPVNGRLKTSENQNSHHVKAKSARVAIQPIRNQLRFVFLLHSLWPCRTCPHIPLIRRMRSAPRHKVAHRMVGATILLQEQKPLGSRVCRRHRRS